MINWTDNFRIQR